VPLDRAGLEILDVDECLRLLRSVQVGRVAVPSEASPIIFPVNFGVLDASVVFRTGEGTKLDAAIRNAAVAFEADAIHSIFETGWSVVVVGRAEEVLDPTEIDRVTQMGLRSWAPGSRSHLIKISPTLLSGRRIVGDDSV
jgi:nitroimidazol reductase NimA-like FMN-containing flavoprotein (pyridoxamine 5'-phosphate oxidase superfamily)